MFRESSHGQLGREGGGQVVGGGGEQVGGVGVGGGGWVGQVSNLNFRTNIPSGNESNILSLSEEWEERKCFSQPQFSTDQAHLFTSGRAYTV